MRRYFLYLGKKYEKDYYSSIKELPVENWWRVLEGENPFKWLLKTRRTSKLAIVDITRIWETLEDEFLDTFSIPPDAVDLLRLKMKLEWMEVQILQGKTYYTIHANILRRKIKEKEDSDNGDPRDSLFYFSKNMRYPPNTKEFTVYTYYKFIKLQNDEARKYSTRE